MLSTRAKMGPKMFICLGPVKFSGKEKYITITYSSINILTRCNIK